MSTSRISNLKLLFSAQLTCKLVHEHLMQFYCKIRGLGGSVLTTKHTLSPRSTISMCCTRSPDGSVSSMENIMSHRGQYSVVSDAWRRFGSAITPPPTVSQQTSTLTSCRGAMTCGSKSPPLLASRSSANNRTGVHICDIRRHDKLYILITDKSVHVSLLTGRSDFTRHAYLSWLVLPYKYEP